MHIIIFAGPSLIYRPSRRRYQQDNLKQFLTTMLIRKNVYLFISVSWQNLRRVETVLSVEGRKKSRREKNPVFSIPRCP